MPFWKRYFCPLEIFAVNFSTKFVLVSLHCYTPGKFNFDMEMMKMFDKELFLKLVGRKEDEVHYIERLFASRYFANLELMNTIENKRPAKADEIAKRHTVTGRKPAELFQAAKVVLMSEILSADEQSAKLYDGIDFETNKRKLISEMAAIMSKDEIDKATKLEKLFARDDVFSVINFYRSKRVKWEFISIWLKKKHSKAYKLAVDNQTEQLADSTMTRAWRNVCRRKKALENLKGVQTFDEN